ncbi:MAG: hypothetical protein O3A93_00240 [Chloroflexi bacterium]|nr:hypothetical protein [Chloroflexota bacterium]MDA1269677.1 hypothetical protein [Chloroflexota bacterium]PKB58385.1 MAG: hypothetical protein BZY83_07315 [SAR202 cluster bacterium Casp-Chloro-G2]
MRRLGVFLVPIMLLAVACSELMTPGTPLPPNLEATVRALVAEAQGANQPAQEQPDNQATIAAQVQATVRALLEATPIPSPTPTQAAVPTPTPTRTSSGGIPAGPTPPLAGSVSTFPTATPTAIPTIGPTMQTGCSVAPDGVIVSAWVNGVLAASTTVKSGEYHLRVEQPPESSFSGQTINFTVGNAEAAQTLAWVQGDATKLDLTAPESGTSAAPKIAGQPSLKGGPLAQPVPPHIVLGAVSIGNC